MPDTIHRERPDRPPVRERLTSLVRDLSADPDLSDDDLVAVHNAAVRETKVRQEAARWRETAHVHDVPHAPTVTVHDDGSEEVDAEGVVCHDCGKHLVADVGTVRYLVCPSLHGRRPQELEPAGDAAVECGRGQ